MVELSASSPTPNSESFMGVSPWEAENVISFIAFPHSRLWRHELWERVANSFVKFCNCVLLERVPERREIFNGQSLGAGARIDVSLVEGSTN